MYLHKTPGYFSWLYPNRLWHKGRKEHVIYLTFDDGPIPGPTEFVLAALAEAQAKATFFCVGDNIRKYPGIFSAVIGQGHGVGNHTYHHLDGWRTGQAAYLADIRMCQDQMLRCGYPPGGKSLFRPPYGKMKRPQARAVHDHYTIVMWDVLSGDFDRALPPADCLARTIAATRPGSVVVFHDSLKAEASLRYALPKYLAHWRQLGYSFAAL